MLVSVQFSRHGQFRDSQSEGSFDQDKYSEDHFLIALKGRFILIRVDKPLARSIGHAERRIGDQPKLSIFSIFMIS